MKLFWLASLLVLHNEIDYRHKIESLELEAMLRKGYVGETLYYAI